MDRFLPPIFLNPLGFIDYRWDGLFPWGSGDAELLAIPKEMKGLTNLLAVAVQEVRVRQGNGEVVPELGRVSIVNEYGFGVYDSFVKPDSEVELMDTEEKQNNNPWVKGLSMEIVENGTPIDVVVADVEKIVEGRTLVGHGINDILNLLRIWVVDDQVRDVQMIYRDLPLHPLLDFPLLRGPSIQELAKRFLPGLQRRGPKSSILDAQISLRLYLNSIEEDKENPLIVTDFTEDCDQETLIQEYSYQCHAARLESESWATSVGRDDDVADYSTVPKPLFPKKTVNKPKSVGDGGPEAVNAATTTTPSVDKGTKCSAGLHDQYGLKGRLKKKTICLERVEVKCKRDRHTQIMQCYKAANGEREKCREIVLKDLPCGHHAKFLCSDKKRKMSICVQPVQMKCRAGLHDFKNPLPCHEAEARKMENRECICNTTVWKTLTCGHLIQASCGSKKALKCVNDKCSGKSISMGRIPLPTYKLEEIDNTRGINKDLLLVTRTLNCGHSVCVPSYLRNVDANSVICISTKKCTHGVAYPCDLENRMKLMKHPGTACQALCGQTLHCGHPCQLNCHEAFPIGAHLSLPLPPQPVSPRHSPPPSPPPTRSSSPPPPPSPSPPASPIQSPPPPLNCPQLREEDKEASTVIINSEEPRRRRRRRGRRHDRNGTDDGFLVLLEAIFILFMFVFLNVVDWILQHGPQ